MIVHMLYYSNSFVVFGFSYFIYTEEIYIHICGQTMMEMYKDMDLTTIIYIKKVE
jgi:hypothetical protein